MRYFFPVCLLFSLITGCATVQNSYDPIEPVNRGIYKFNRTFDKYLAKPIAQGYDKITPKPVKKSVGNFYFNFGGIRTTVHNTLQGKFRKAGQDASRFAINSTIGILGLFDVASLWGIEKNKEDFGQTVGVWGIQNPPYLILPFLGPSNLVDAPGLFIDSFLGPYPYIEDITTRNILFGVDFVETRASYLTTDSTLDQQEEEYAAMRDAYQQKRRSEIRDGKEDNSIEKEIEELQREGEE